MRKIIPLRDARKRRLKHSRTAKAQTSTTRQADKEDGMVTIQLKDGTWKTISGSNLEMDIEYRDGVPCLIVTERR